MVTKHFEPYQRDLLLTISREIPADLDEVRSIYWEVMNSGICSLTQISQFQYLGIPVLAQFEKTYQLSSHEVIELALRNAIKFENVESLFLIMTSPGGIFYKQ